MKTSSFSSRQAAHDLVRWARTKARPLRQRQRRLVAALRPRQDVLVYVGVNRGDGFDALIPLHRRCFGFEANPELCVFLRDKYKRDPRVEIIHAAASSHNGVVSLNIA